MIKHNTLSDIRKKIAEVLKDGSEYEVKVSCKSENAEAFELRLRQFITEVTGIPWEDMIKKGRQQKIVAARQLYSFFMRSYTDLSLQRIGSELRVDHTTVIEHVKKANNYIETNDLVFYPLYKTISEKLFEYEV